MNVSDLLIATLVILLAWYFVPGIIAVILTVLALVSVLR